MKTWKKALLFALAVLPIAIVGGWFITRYQLDLLDPAAIAEAMAQVGGNETLLYLITIAQTVLYACVLGFLGCLMAAKTGLLRPFRLEKRPFLIVLIWSVLLGVLLSLDHWTFCRWIPQLQEAEDITASLTPSAWIGSILYGGVVEEIMLRLFLMTLLVLLGWKLFFRRRETPPTGVLIGANVIAALLFAAGHIPATVALFGAMTPLLLVRCFLLNGIGGLLFGRAYRKYGIHYAMLSHALAHIVSKLIWTIFL